DALAGLAARARRLLQGDRPAADARDRDERDAGLARVAGALDQIGAPLPGTTRHVKRSKEPPAPARVLSIHAHPDDQEFTVAGTLAKWARAGSAIVTVCITSGGAGSNQHTPPTMTREELATIREDEQRGACGALGVAEVVFLRYEDGLLEPSIALRRELTRLIRRHRPD